MIEDSIQSSGNSLKKYSEAYYNISQLNEGIGFPPAQFNLTTPQATLEHFIVKSRNKDFQAVAYALNLNLLPDNISISDAAILAKKLNFVLEQRVSLSCDDLSDRPDGQIDISTSTNKAVAGKPRRSINFGK